MKIYSVEISEAEDLALSSVCISQQEWIENSIHERCRVAIDEIVKTAFERYLSEGIAIPSTKELIVTDAFARGWFIPAKDIVVQEK